MEHVPHHKVNQGYVEARIGTMSKMALYDRKYYKSYTEEIHADLLQQKQQGKDFSDTDTLDEHMFGDQEGQGSGKDGENDPIGQHLSKSLRKKQKQLRIR